MGYFEQVVVLYVLILVPSLVFLGFYMSTRRQRLILLDVPLVGTPVVCILLSVRAIYLVVSAPSGTLVPPSGWEVIFSLATLVMVGVVVWSLLVSLYIARVRSVDYVAEVEKAMIERLQGR